VIEIEDADGEVGHAESLPEHRPRPGLGEVVQHLI
jgi:hypothetical protein